MAFVMNSGMIFSGYWCGPNVLEPRVTIAGNPYELAIRLHLQLSARLARAVRAAGTERIALDTASADHLAVDLVGAHLHESLVLMLAGRVHEHERSVDVGEDELPRRLERPVHVRLGGEVHDHVDVRRQLSHDVGVADVAADEPEARVGADRIEIALVAGVGELVEHDHRIAGVIAEGHAHELAADESRPTGDQQAHVRCSRWSSRSRSADRSRGCVLRRGPRRRTAR